MIEIYLLEQLAAFQEYGTLSESAEHLHLSQPSLSRSMQKLEKQLGVKLFERHKNKLILNDTGILAASYASRILADEAEMETQIALHVRNKTALSIGSCAPGPLMNILPSLAGRCSEMTVSSDLTTEEELLKGLYANQYQMIILNHPVSSEEYTSTEYVTEHLYLSVNRMHPAASYHSITFKEMDGQNFIMYAKVGVWDALVQKKMPHAKFFRQENLEALSEITDNSDLPSFATDIALHYQSDRHSNRITIPFSDSDASITFYIICKVSADSRLKQIIRQIISAV